MYTIVTPQIGRYRKTAIYATSVSPFPLVFDGSDSPQSRMVFTVRPLPPYPDIYWNTAGVWLVHERVAAVFDAFATPHTSYPVVFRHPITQAVLPQGRDYRVYQITATAPILTVVADPASPSERRWGRMQLHPAVGDHLPRVCFDQHWPTLLCVHRTVRACLEARKVTGGCFLSVAEAWGSLQPLPRDA